MKNKSLLLIIDMQNDFCNPSGALYVPGAESDVERTANFIKQKSDELGCIVLLQDIHQVIDISHPGYWRDKNGNMPAPLTTISVADVEAGVYIPQFEEQRTIDYLRNLEAQGEFPHTIWPVHCVEGSEATAIVPQLMDAVKQWAAKGNFYKVFQKGRNPFTEHFGALKANIPDSNDTATQENKELLAILAQYDKIYLAGEAKSHCVAYTVNQIAEHAQIVNKIVVLQNCMSVIPGFEHTADYIYNKLKPEQFIEV